MDEGKIHIGICNDFDDVHNILIKDSLITSEELIGSLKDGLNECDLDEIDGIDSISYRRHSFENCDVEFFRLKLENFPQYKELLDIKERYEELTRENIVLKDDIEKLKKRNIFLECEPYRGPEFFQMLNEEKSEGLIFK